MKKHKGMKGHTGDVLHGSHLHPKSGNDPHASAEHNEANKAFDMDDGMAPQHNAGQGEGSQPGVPNTAGNCSYS